MATKKTKKETESTATQPAAAQTQTTPQAQPANDLTIADLKNIIEKEVSVRNWLMKM